MGTYGVRRPPMRHPLILVAALLCAASAADAQVTVDLHALDPLPAANPAPRPAPRPQVDRRPKVSLPAVQVPAKPAATEPPAVPEVSAGAPPGVGAAAPPPSVAPAAPAAPPAPPAPVAAAAKPVPASAASIRISFPHEQSSLTAAGAEAIKGLVRTVAVGGVTGFTVTGYADGSADDPSSGRRLSLARAMAARGALLEAGIPSNQITVRALGGRVGDGPPDRVDIATGNPTGTP